jgi:prepilin-type N-terminal cleavage/methylation domain-containing protein
MYSNPERVTRSRGGFTLIEMMVALVISGLLTGVIFQVIGGNSRFVSMQSAREEVQQNSRAAIDLITSDLRSAASAGLLEMEPNSVRLNVPRAWGVLCSDLTPTSTNVWAVFPAGTLPPDFTLAAQAPHWGIAIHQTGDPTTSTNLYRFVNAVGPSTSTNPCSSFQPNLTAQHVAMGFSKASGQFVNSHLTIRSGTPVMIYEQVRYDVAQPSGSSDFWIRRMSGFSSGTTPNMQPMAGPVPGATALSFTYLQADGTTAATAAGAVRQVRVKLTTNSRSRTMQAGELRPQQTDSTTVDVFLRN